MEPTPHKISIEAAQVRLARRPSHEELLQLIENGATRIVPASSQKPTLFGVSDEGVMYVMDLMAVFTEIQDEERILTFVRNFLAMHKLTLSGFILESCRVAGVKHGDPDDDALLEGRITTDQHPRKMDTLSIFIQDAAGIDHHLYQILGKPGKRELGQRESHLNVKTKWRFYGSAPLQH